MGNLKVSNFQLVSVQFPDNKKGESGDGRKRVEVSFCALVAPVPSCPSRACERMDLRLVSSRPTEMGALFQILIGEILSFFI